MSESKDRKPFITLLLLMTIVRFIVFYFFPDFSNRVEVVTPLTSFQSLKEGYFLKKKGYSPYEGDIFHMPPWILSLFPIISDLEVNRQLIFFSVLDYIAAITLYKIAQRFYETLDLKKMGLKKSTMVDPFVIFVAYLFNPFVIMSCVAKSLGIMNTLSILLSILLALKGKKTVSLFFLAVATNWSLYPIILFPSIIVLSAKMNPKTFDWISGILSFIWWTVLLNVLCFTLTGSWDYLHHTLKFIIFVPDLTPNTGLFWYFFIEVFEHFRTLFIVVFQIHVLGYMIPLSFRFRHDPLFAVFCLCGITSIFKSYPSISDFSLFISLFPLFGYIFKNMKTWFIVGVAYFFSFLLAPIFWFLWIDQGSGNANFYYAITLVFSLANVMVLVDAMTAHRKHTHYIQNPTQTGLELTTK